MGVSGGPDSIALLTLLSKLQRKYALTLVVAHLHHGLLKKEGERFLSLVRKNAETLGFAFYSKKISLKKLAEKNKRSLEEMGRIERYRFFEAVANKTKADKIVTAHTLDDQAETVLMRIFRGSGLRGLTGIPYKRRLGPYQLIRPLLNTQKKDILSFLKQNRIPFCVDKSNRNAVFTRNRLRHDLLPRIASGFNPQIKKSLSQLQAVSSETQDYLDSIACKELKKSIHGKPSKKRLSLKLQKLKDLHPAILREVVLLALSRLRGNLKRFAYSHIQGIAQMAHSNENGLELHLPGPMTVRKTSNSLDLIC